MDSETVDEKIRDAIRHAMHERPQADKLERLRDEFAMAALTGIVAKPTNASSSFYAASAYDIANAMMEARKK